MFFIFGTVYLYYFLSSNLNWKDAHAVFFIFTIFVFNVIGFQTPYKSALAVSMNPMFSSPLCIVENKLFLDIENRLKNCKEH